MVQRALRGEMSEHGMATAMVGRELSDIFPPKDTTSGEALLEVRNLNVQNVVKDVSLTLHKGEVLGIAGLVGSGRTELAEGIVGLRPASGEIRIHGKPVNIRNPRDARDARLAYLTEDRKEVGLTLKVRPQISEGGTIKLGIYHETSSVDKSTSTAVSGITINNRVIENNVLADDGQIIVLGGLIEDSTGDNAEKVRGLGDIHLLGNLFKYQTRERKKTNLMICLRPVIVRNKEQSGSLAADRYDYMCSAETAAVPATGNLMLKDLGTPVLPALQDGQPVGGNMVTRPVPPAPTPPPGAPANAATPPQSMLQQYQQQQQPQK